VRQISAIAGTPAKKGRRGTSCAGFGFRSGGAEQWLSYVLIAAGWTLATTVAAGAARFLQRG
jgi:hypothetical protein